jgi:DNA-binding response OmpR family regulator
MYSLFLKKEGYDVLALQSDGNVAIEKCRELMPDVILMDVNLKNNTNGFASAREIRKQNDALIIFTTGNSSAETIQESSDIKNSVVLTKPVEPNEILRVIRNYFSAK